MCTKTNTTRKAAKARHKEYLSNQYEIDQRSARRLCVCRSTAKLEHCNRTNAGKLRLRLLPNAVAPIRGTTFTMHDVKIIEEGISNLISIDLATSALRCKTLPN